MQDNRGNVEDLCKGNEILTSAVATTSQRMHLIVSLMTCQYLVMLQEFVCKAITGNGLARLQSTVNQYKSHMSKRSQGVLLGQTAFIAPQEYSWFVQSP